MPGFFQNSSGTGLVIGSRVTTLTGSVIVALPLSVTHESLRPYAVGGLGVLHATSEDLLSLNAPGSVSLFCSTYTGRAYHAKIVAIKVGALHG